MTVKVRLRPTGSSILVGFVDQPSLEIKHYRDTLEIAVKNWQNTLGANPELSSVHTSFPPGNFFKPCGFLGIGPWSYIFLTLLTEQGLANHLAFLGHIRGQHYFHLHEYSLYVSTQGNHELMRDWAATRKATIVLRTALEKPLETLRNQPRPLLKLRDQAIPALAFNKTHGFFPFFHSTKLTDIGDGCQEISPNHQVPEDQAKRLLGFYQLKLHPLLTIFDYEHVKLVTHLLILETAFQLKQKHRDEDVWPTFARPYICDGYFDIVVLMRGLSLKAMDRLMQPIKTMTVAEVWNILPEFAKQDAGIRHFLKKLPQNHPWFSVSHSTLGIPNIKLDRVEEIIAGQANPDQALNQFRECFSDYNHQDALKPNTMVTAKVGRMGEIPTIEGNFRQLSGWPEEHKRFMQSGRYDYPLFPSEETYELGEFLALLQYSKWLFRRKYCQGQMPVMKHRIRLPVISTKTNLAYEGQVPQMEPRLLTEDLKDHQSLCLLWLPNMERLFSVLKFDGRSDDPVINANYEKSRSYWVKKPDDKNYCQIRFYNFLKDRFGDEVTPGTLQRVFTAFCAVDSLLADPLLFYLYLDVANYLRHWMKILFTVRSQTLSEMRELKARNCDDTANQEPGAAVGILFFHPHTKKIARKFPRRYGDGNSQAHYVGLEALFLNLIQLIQEVTDHRQTGSYPNYDRSFSRISDFCLQHSKKMMAISWMINDLVNATCHMLPSFIGMEFDSCIDLDLSGDDWSFGNDDFTFSRANQRFRPSEEIIFPPETILTRFTHAPEVTLLHSINCLSINVRQLTSAESLCLLAHEIGHAIAFRIKEHNAGPHVFSSDLWEEVFAELFHFKICYAQLYPLFQGDFNAEGAYRIYTKRRVDQFSELGPDTYDLYDDFIQATIFQFLMLPSIRRRQSFEETLIRLSVVLIMLKIHAYPHLAQLHPEQVYQTVVEPFWEHKFPQLFRHLGHLEGIPHHSLNHSSWLQALPGAPEHAGLFAKVRAETCRLFREFKVHQDTLLGTYFSFLAKRDDSPAAGDYYHFRILEEPVTFFQLMAGIMPDSLSQAPEGDSFAGAFQLMGMINLGFVQNLHRAELKFIEGYPGFENMRDQQSLAKLRRMIHALIGNGAMKMIHKHLKRRGFYQSGGCWDDS